MTQNERVKDVRKSLGLTMEKFGDKLGVGKTAISGIETGRRNLTEQMLKSICREFDINEEWLRYGTGLKDRQVTYDEEVAMYTQDILDDVESEVAARVRDFIVLYGKLDENSRSVLNRVFKDMSDMKKSRDES